MRKWIGIVTGTLCILTSTLIADEALPPAAEPAVETATTPETFAATPDQAPKQVGKVSVDSTNTAKSSNATKYILAATAVAVGITAIILVSRHHGHRHHGKGH